MNDLNQKINFGYLRYFFYNATKNNFKRMLLLSRDHYDKLKARAVSNPNLLPLFTAYEIDYNDFVSAMQLSANTALDRQTYTYRLQEAFTDMREKVEDWDIRIMFKYRPNTPDYKFLMGIGRTPFAASTYDQRLNLTQELSDRLARYPDLDDVKQDIDAWYATVNAIRTTQQGLEGNLNSAQLAVEAARQRLAVRMQWVFAGLMFEYFDRLWEVETFYELKYLQRGTSKAGLDTPDTPTPNASSISVAAASQSVISTGKYEADDIVQITNNSTGEIFIMASNDANATQAVEAVLVPSGDTVSFAIEEISDNMPPYKYIIVFNPNNVTAKVMFAKLE